MARQASSIPPAAESKVLSMRLGRAQVQRLERYARIYGISAAQAGARLLEEKLREQDFPSIDFRNTSIGRLAFIKGHRLAVWQVAMLATDYGGDSAAVAAGLSVPEVLVAEALAYANTYPDEISPVVQEAQSVTPEDLKRRMPSLQRSTG